MAQGMNPFSNRQTIHLSQLVRPTAVGSKQHVFMDIELEATLDNSFDNQIVFFFFLDSYTSGDKGVSFFCQAELRKASVGCDIIDVI